MVIKTKNIEENLEIYCPPPMIYTKTHKTAEKKLISKKIN